ncbi:MAG TPA: exodeoxyribonuclease VII small subunit [Candidatus Binataceae bacterium]|nr:exodeoxyribonuclease VII small subunit [Candidatus Binataceae bacterium]
MADNDVERFEDQLAELEAIVGRIDSGELSLEEAIGAFERGVGLVRALNQKLDEFDRRVEVLTRGAGGELRRSPSGAMTDAFDDGADDDRDE